MGRITDLATGFPGYHSRIGKEHGFLSEMLVPLYQRSGVKVVLSGHEHNFQHSHVDGID